MQVSEIRWFYRTQPVQVPESWDLSRRHLRLETLNRKFVKLNSFENRINPKELTKYCIRYAPRHVYASALKWLFPERVGRKCKANFAVPFAGDYAVDIDAYVIRRWNIQHDCLRHNGVCRQCVDLSKRMTVQLCEKM